MTKKTLSISWLLVVMACFSLQAVAQVGNRLNHEKIMGEPSYSTPQELLKSQRLMDPGVKGTDPRPIFPTTEKFFVRYVDKGSKTVEIAPAQSANDRLVEGVYYKNVVIPEKLHVKDGGSEVICTVVAVGRGAFAFNEIYTVQYPKTCKEIKDRAYSMVSLKECVIPDQIEKIGDEVFRYCKLAKKIVVGKGLKSIGSSPFADCLNVSAITVDPENTILSVQDNILYDKKQTILYLCPSERKEVSTVTLPNTVKEVGDYAFVSCIYLKHVILNEGLEKIGKDAFYGCVWLEEMSIPASVKAIAPGAFTLLKKCETFKVADGNETFEVKSDGVHEGKLLINKADKSLHTCLYKDTKVVTIPDGIVAVGPYAFLACDWTTSITFPVSIERVGQASFSEMYSLTEIEIPEKVTEIPPYCLSDCKKLTTITLGKNIAKVGYAAFSKNEMMESKGGLIRILATTPPEVGTDIDGSEYDMGDNFYKRVILEVPAESVDAYKKAPKWRLFRKVHALGTELIQPQATLQIRVAQGMLSIVAPEIAPIAIYTPDGQAIYTTTAREAQIAIPAGLYIITYGTQTKKVFVY